MSRAGGLAAVILLASLWPSPIQAQDAIATLLFRVFLTDGRVITSFGEYARLDDRVVFSMPTRIRPEPGGFELVSIPADRVDWQKTTQYADRVHAAAYASSRGAADFAQLSNDLARTLSEVSQIADPGVRLATAVHARQTLAEWPNAHYGYKVAEVREFLGVLDGIIAELRSAVGQTRFDLSLTTPLAAAPEPPLPPPTDTEIVEQMMTAASLAEAQAERIGLLQKVMNLLDSTMGLLMPPEWSARIRKMVLGDLAQEQRIALLYSSLRTSALEESAKAARRGDVKDLERLRARVLQEDQRLGQRQPGEIAALVATLDVQLEAARDTKVTREQWSKRAPLYRSYRRAMANSFSTFKDATGGLEQVRSMSGPPANKVSPLVKRLARAERTIAKVTPPDELASGHALVRSAWELAQNAFRLRLAAGADNSVVTARQASSAAAGALMLYQKARGDLQSIMEQPARK